ncbi:hypothetical protein MMAD_04180 [Mycolicibacterium madagascariense]|uniref:Uncharacterized protein n=1 Tax=Mycolicibacterium madagascariense TaxID=212765 RepID=A0A7I7XB02_9MYCO|nr:hypothetical protein [Mycolicibacterium madagascariense]BBZ26123.1 hypothetical protein MMAD_04180 [Mycolicibacterium madagascariense]
MTIVVIAVVVGLLGIGLAASQLMRLRTYLNQPPADPPVEPTDPE